MWSRARIILVAAGATVVAAGLAVQLGACSGTRPSGVGTNAGRLKACPESPNCVSSFVSTTDEEHYIEPIARRADPDVAMRVLRQVVSNMSRTKIIEVGSGYLYVEFKSLIFRFVDDVEFVLPPGEAAIHVRSASRKGHSDLGVNRRRIGKVRSRYRKAESKHLTPP